MKILYSAEYSAKIQNSVLVLVQTNLNFKILYSVPVQPNSNRKIRFWLENLNSFVPYRYRYRLVSVSVWYHYQVPGDLKKLYLFGGFQGEHRCLERYWIRNKNQFFAKNIQLSHICSVWVLGFIWISNPHDLHHHHQNDIFVKTLTQPGRSSSEVQVKHWLL